MTKTRSETSAGAIGLPLVYEIYCRANGMRYIGSTKRPWAEHRAQYRSSLRAGRHHNRPLQADWNEHGEKNFTLRVMFWAAEPFDVRFLERVMIDQLGTTDPDVGYNLSDDETGRRSREVRLRQQEKQLIRGGKLQLLAHIRLGDRMTSAYCARSVLPGDSRRQQDKDD